jgi:hypothetical protein
MAGDWIVAGKAASNMLNDRLKSTAKMAANGIPSFLETGQNLIQILAKDPTWTNGTLSEKNILLGDNLRTIPYFNEFYLLDAKGQAVTGYPADVAPPPLLPEEYMGITLAGVAIQMCMPPTVGRLFAPFIHGSCGWPVRCAHRGFGRSDRPGYQSIYRIDHHFPE